MDLWHDIKPGSEQNINVIVEVPKGSQNKYEYDKDHKMFALDRVLFSPLNYPGDYGFIPQTYCEDGDPLDALILVTNPSFPGIIIKARPIGVMRMIDGGEEDDKLLCVPTDDPRFRHIQDLKDVPQHILDEIAHFFKVYKELENKQVEVKGWHDKAAAIKTFNASLELYKKEFS